MHGAEDALASKLSAIQLKYITNDNYSHHFYKKPKVKKSPIINRGNMFVTRLSLRLIIYSTLLDVYMYMILSILLIYCRNIYRLLYKG